MPKAKDKPRELTEKQRRFVDAYMGEALGNAMVAARLAGYKGSDNSLASVGYNNLRKPVILARIEELREEQPLSLGRIELQDLWSRLATDVGEETKDRLRATELLARSQAMFIEKREIVDKTPARTVNDLTPEQLADKVARAKKVIQALEQNHGDPEKPKPPTTH